MNTIRRCRAGIAMAAVTLLFGAACGSDDPASSADPAPAPSATASAAGLSAADTAICTDIDKATQEMMASFLAKGMGEENAAMRDALKGFLTQLREKSATAQDPALRDALQQVITAGERFTGSLSEADSAAYETAGEKLKKACGAGEEGKAPLAAGARVGAAGSPCELPVSFSAGEKWQAEAVNAKDAGALGDLLRKGTLEVVCEVKGRPAGTVAFLRVWTDPGASGGPRKVLEGLLKGEENVKKPKWSETTVGGAPGAEVVFGKYSKLLEETRTERAFAVQTPKGAVVVTLSGTEAEDAAAVAAYDLARTSLTVNS